MNAIIRDPTASISTDQGSPTFIDLFAGCGGLSLGFLDAGWKPVQAVEKDPAAALSYHTNFDASIWVGLVEEFSSGLASGRLAPVRADAVIGGPPCQGFSPLGRMSAKNGASDAHFRQNGLWRYFLDVVETVGSEVFVVENVPQFLKSEEFRDFCSRADHMGYHLTAGVLKAVEFGVPQTRKRAFCIGARTGIPFLPEPCDDRRNVRDAIGHLSAKPNEKNWHIGRSPTEKSLERYRLIPPGGNRFDLVNARPDLAPECWKKKKSGTTDVFGRLTWDRPAHTIRTEFFKPEKGRYLHPEADRPITHREAACIQTFPSSFNFQGSKTQVARQIGEAVPPRLAFQVAMAARTLTADRRSSKS